jgi:TolB-like protein/Tfp pilus assembly protein PilF
MSFFNELKRRNVIRVGVAYMVAAWLLLQIVDVLVPILDLPDWVGKLVFLFLAIGLIPALIISWAYEMTPEGLKRDSEVAPDQSIAQFTAKKLDRITIILLLIVAGIVVMDRFIPETSEQQVSDPPNVAAPGIAPPVEPNNEQAETGDERQSVAVIPFVNMSDDEANEYFSDGISEELLNALVHIKSLRVPSRTSSFTFKGSDKKLSEIGQELGVEHVLEGSVRKSGNRIRVTAQLIEVKSDTHLWSETYTRELDDIFEVQDEIASAIVDALQIALSGADQQSLITHSTSNIQAFNKYLLGRYLWNQRGGHRSGESLLSAVDAFREAVEMDPEYDQAWAALADTYVVIPEYSVGTVEEYIPLAREATSKALSINPDSAKALTASGYINAIYDFDWAAANSNFARAIALEPGYATAHQWYGTMLFYQGRLEEALVQAQLARIADPLSAVVRHAPGFYLLWSNRLDEAEVHFMDVLDLGQPFRWTIFTLDILNTLEGNYDEARRRARQLAEMEGFDPAADLARIDAVEDPALKEPALTLLRDRQDLRDGVMGKALQYALLGEYDSALESLEIGFKIGDPTAPRMGVMQVYKPLHDNPRFQAMLKEMNLLP